MTPGPTTTGGHSVYKARISPWWWALAGAGALVMVVSLILWLGAAKNEAGKPWIDSPTPIVVAIIAGMSSIGAVVIPKLQAIGNNTSQTAEHVVNSHTGTILRDDVDKVLRKLDDLAGGMQQMQKVQGLQQQDMILFREELGQFRKSDHAQWAEIESTAGKLRQRGESE